MKRALLIGGVGLIGAAVLLMMIWRRSVSDSSRNQPARAENSGTPAPIFDLESRAAAESVFPLNRAGGTIHEDVQLLAEVFGHWQTNFPATGNPVGTNAEITAALCGDNSLKLDLVPRAHPAINARDELCDRWGTPFRFHQQSSREMEIISAGPDRDFATADDVKFP